MAIPYAAPCKQRRAKHDSGPRKASSIRLIVIHSAESTSAAGVAAFFATTAQASTQLAVDEKECWRMLPDLVIPWGAPGANSDGLHIEICGYASWTRAQWLAHEKTLRRSAYKAAKWCWQHKIPARWLTEGQLGGKTARGLVTHKMVSDVFKGSAHWDPGPQFPRDTFIRWVKEYLAEIRQARDR